MFRKILYPTDFSDVSKIALNYLRQLKESGAEEILVLHVIDKKDLQFSYLYLFDESWGFRVSSSVKLGVPIKEILNAEQNKDISIIVIGSHGKSNVEEMLLGSVSENIIRKCKKPVLVVKR